MELHEKVEPGYLLEEGWFFGNFLDIKTKMSRSYSDPYPSSNYSQEMIVRKTSYGENSSSPNKLLHELIGAPTSIARREEVTHSKVTVSNTRSSRRNLIRAPSLPPCIGREEVEDQESDFTMGRLIRQASLNSAEILPPRHASKSMTQSSSLPRHHPRKKPEPNSINMEGCKEMRRRYLINQTKIGKSPSDLESQEVEGCKDLGFIFDKKDLDPNVVNILPGLQEKSRVDSDEQEKVRRPYLSEAWLVNTSAPKIPNWVEKKSAEDMKAQIKFWARAVASNVRQEC